MADSNITKRALGGALKALMEETPFKKISVADICEKCDMNRKSFYYHFKDKYDLVNWIFDTEFMQLLKARQNEDHWEVVETMCRYFYENRGFYYKVLQVQGQNSFGEHFHAFLRPLIHERIQEMFGVQDVHPLCVDFYTDGVVCTIMRWLLDRDCVPPEELIKILRELVENTVNVLYRELSQ